VQVARAQLVAVPARLEHAHAVHRQLDGARGIEARHADPLAGRRVSVLHAGVAQVALVDVAGARDAPHRLERRQVGLLDPQEGVLALARRQVGRDLLDHEGRDRCVNVSTSDAGALVRLGSAVVAVGCPASAIPGRGVLPPSSSAGGCLTMARYMCADLFSGAIASTSCHSSAASLRRPWA